VVAAAAAWTFTGPNAWWLPYLYDVPWANRSIIVRRLLGLESAFSMGICGPTHDERSWTFDLDPGGRDPVLGYERLQEAFLARDPEYPRGITVPDGQPDVAGHWSNTIGNHNNLTNPQGGGRGDGERAACAVR